MCGYSLHSVRSRPAKIGDKTGTRGFAAAEDCTTAVCVLPGTELAFLKEVAWFRPDRLFFWKQAKVRDRMAIFRQVNTDRRCTHHDALEFPDGRIVLLTSLCEGQAATVLQLPAQPATGAETGEQNYVTWLNELLPEVSLATPQLDD